MTFIEMLPYGFAALAAITLFVARCHEPEACSESWFKGIFDSALVCSAYAGSEYLLS